MQEGKKKILIVDDDPDIRLFLAFSLKKAGYEVLQAANGAKALDILKDGTPDLIVTDAMMPVLDGYELIKAVKGEPASRGIPMLMLTGKDSEGLTEGNARPEAYMRKPFATPDILALIQKLLTNP
jgi:CheY-like chemotaxis protein